MRLAGIHIATILLIVGFCEANSSGRDSSKVKSTTETTVDDSELSDAGDTRSDASTVKGEQPEDDLPILPPIILLDFGNSTDDNENATSEEKSKRTVNNGIGYGLAKNSLNPVRYNYYFPGGKTGTTVSIEESISPFLPKTIIEKVPNTNDKARPFASRYNFYGGSSSGSHAQSQVYSGLQYLTPEQSTPQPVFGQRTKLQKTPVSNFAYQNFLSTPKPSVSSYGVQSSGYRGNVVSTSTQSPLAYGSSDSGRYVTSNSVNYAGQQGNSFGYVTQSPFSHHPGNSIPQTYGHGIPSNIKSQGYVSHGQSAESSTVSPVNYSHFSRPPTVPNRPKYTIENGIRYENKIFWKYPDGRVSDVPPATYVETSYPDYPQEKPQSPLSIYDSTNEGGVYSQGPVQFPAMPESPRQEPSPFISSESLSSSLPQQQVYRLGYQNLVTQKQSANVAQGKPSEDAAASYSSFPSSASALKSNPSGYRNYESYSHQPPSRYMANSPNPEYTDSYPTEPTINATTPSTSLFTPSGELSPHITSKYTPKVQNYLRTVFAAGQQKKQNQGTKNLDSYSNIQYSDLLNYNPSISQYIRNPSSILNVRPTFVQAGNSLIPVIILRVDGASPVQPKVTPNINLKALLQQYLIQYANSIQQLAQPSSYDFDGQQQEQHQSSASNRSPVLDLIRLTQQDARDQPSYTSDSYSGRSSYDTSNLDVPQTNYAAQKYGERSAVRQKVKSVQILDDPRYTSYNVKN